MKLDVDLAIKPVPDTEGKLDIFVSLMTEMVLSMVEGERDSKENPEGNPLQFDAVPSPIHNTVIINE